MKKKITVTNDSNALTVTNGYRFLNIDLQADWLRFLDVKPATARNYFKAVKKFAAFCAARSINQPTTDNIIDFKRFLLDTLAPTSAQLYLTAVKLFFRFLDRQGIYKNVADHVKGVKLSAEHHRDALSSDQCRQVVARIDTSTILGLRNRAIIALMMSCGLRSVEVARADVTDIESLQGMIFIRVQGKGRDDKAERVRLAPTVLQFINEYLDARGDRNGALFQSTSARNRGQRLQTQSISRLTKAAFADAGIISPRITCHSCRHSFATNALLNGVDIANVAMVLRHRSINTTQIYRHDIDRMTNTAELVVADSIFGGMQ